jgi:putative membrane protein
MKRLLWLLKWLIKATVFFTLFAFALNNQQETRVNFFFSTHWSAPTVLVVLSAFTVGVIVGVLGMVPRWWRAHSLCPWLDRITSGLAPNAHRQSASASRLFQRSEPSAQRAARPGH